MFANRSDAGDRLAAELEDRGVEADVVLGIPRGALPVARPVADALEADLGVVVARKLGAPSNPELAIGAVASDGSVWLNDDLVDRLGVSESYLEDVREREAANAREKADRYRGEGSRYRGEGSLPELAGKRVVVVDDGIATGATAIACLRQIREADAERVVLAVPVGSPDTVADLESEADEVIALVAPGNFRAVGQFYRAFGQVTDEEAVEYLEDR
jgi:putative phosphoribosyl transferase